VALLLPTIVGADANAWFLLTSEGTQALERGEYARAEQLLLSALGEAEGSGRRDIRLAASLNNLAVLYEARNELGRAEGLYRQALAIQEQLLGPTHPAVALGLGTLAELQRRRGQYAQAEPLFRRALAAQEQALGSMHPSLARTLDRLAALLRQTGREGEAAGLEARAQDIRARYTEDGSGP
jgi:tetratricopeptide (TPR) repeat protein